MMLSELGPWFNIDSIPNLDMPQVYPALACQLPDSDDSKLFPAGFTCEYPGTGQPGNLCCDG